MRFTDNLMLIAQVFPFFLFYGKMYPSNQLSIFGLRFTEWVILQNSIENQQSEIVYLFDQPVHNY